MANKKGAIKLGILGAIIVLVVTLAVFVIASEQDDELRKELNNYRMKNE